LTLPTRRKRRNRNAFRLVDAAFRPAITANFANT